jgi:hypothetical protein
VGILFIAGGDEMARAVYRSEHRGYWSAALPLVLEKHGFLDVTVAGPEVLRQPDIFDRFAVTLVARLPEEIWTPELAERARAARGGVIVEGPLAPAVAGTLGVRQVGAYPREGSLAIKHQTLRSAARRHSAVAGGRIGRGTSRPVEHDPGLDWTALPVLIDPQQAHAWRAPGWDSERWERVQRDPRQLADWVVPDSGERVAAILSRDGLVGCCFGLFAFLGQSHSAEPFTGMEFRSWPRTEGTEAILLGIIDLLHARAGVSRARLLPWPDGVSWVLNVRHDVDRPLSPADAAELARRHRDAGTAATFYWRARHLRARRGRASARHSGNRTLRLIAAEGAHEIALHTERPWAGGDRELRIVSAVANVPILGTSAHGDATCFRYQGAPNVLWAEAMGMAYTELISHPHSLPHRFPALEPDGTIRVLDVICLPHHESFERSSVDGETLEDEANVAIARRARTGAFVQVLNHPDINLDSLFALLARRRDRGRADWTAARVVDWWRRTHISGVASISVSGDTASARLGSEAAGALIELLRPDGSVVVRGASEPGETSGPPPATPGRHPEPALWEPSERAMGAPSYQGFYEEIPLDDEHVGNAERGRYMVRDAIVELRPPVDWHMDPTSNRAWRFWLHTFQFADVPLRLYQERGLTDHLQRVVDLVMDWIASNPLDGPNTADHAWYDMSVGIRTAIFAHVWQAARHEGLLDRPQQELLLASLEQHRRWLSDPLNYQFHSNHALYEDAGLFTLCARCPELEESERWRAFAQERFLNTLRRQTDLEEGVHLEHSPGYQFHIRELLVRLREGSGIGGAELVRLIDRLGQTAAWFVMPDGSILPFGDTDRVTVPRFARGLRAPDGLLFLPHGGYAIVSHGNSYFATTSCYHTTAHKHADELSWVLYENNQLLVGEAGRYGYRSEEDPQRIYARSAHGHNALIIDDESPDWPSRPRYGSGLIAAGAGFGWYAVLGHNRLLVEDVHRRLFCYRPGEALIVIDQLTVDGERAVERRVHTGEGLHSEMDDGRTVTVAVDRALATVQEWSPAPAELSIIAGRREPRYDAWTFPRDSEEVPVEVISMRGHATDELLVHSVAAAPTELAEVTAQTTPDGYRVVARIDGAEHGIDLEISGPAIWIRRARGAVAGRVERCYGGADA